MRILFFGDSITQGFWAAEAGWVERLRRHYDGLAIKDLGNNMQPEIYNLGISGDTTRDLLGRIEGETKSRKYPDDPLVVVIAIGTNDDLFENGKQWVSPSEFKANLTKIITLLQPLVEHIIFVGSPPCDESKTTPVAWGDYTYTNRELERSEQLITDIAREHHLMFVPVFELFKAKLDAGEDLLIDGLHPNDAGHALIADIVLRHLQEIT